MKGNIYCPLCKRRGHEPAMLGKYEDIVGRGDVYLWCKKCHREIRIAIEDISLEQ